MATMQLDDLYVATMDRDDQNKGKAANTDKKKKSGIKSLLGKLGGKKDKDNSSTTSKNKKIQYKPGSNLLAVGNDSASRSMRADPQLQAAIALSLAESSGVTGTLNEPPFQEYEHDPDLAKAMALSLSSVAAATQSSTQAVATISDDEDEILRRVLEQSKLEAAK
jgi:hypothetical protein